MILLNFSFAFRFCFCRFISSGSKRGQGTRTRKCFKNVKKKKECSRRSRKRVSSGSCCGNMKKGSGDPSAPWLGEVREATKESVPEPRQDGFTFESTTTRKVITKKKNWSAPGPDKIANFWLKNACTLQEGCVQ